MATLAMKPLREIEVPPAFVAVVRRHQGELIGLAAPLLMAGRGREHVQQVMIRVFAGFRVALDAANFPVRAERNAR